MSGSKPAKVFKRGGIQVAIFGNRNRQTGEVFFMAKPQKTYKDKQSGEWKSTDSFNSRDMCVVVQLMSMAASWMLDVEGQDDQQSSVSNVGGHHEDDSEVPF